MTDCVNDFETIEDVYSCGVQLRPQDKSNRATFLKIATVCSIGIVVLFSYIFVEKAAGSNGVGLMGTQAIPTAAILFLSTLVIVYHMYYSATEQNQILPKIDPVHYNDHKSSTINTINWIIGITGVVLVIIYVVIYRSDRKTSDIGQTDVPDNIFKIGGLLAFGISTIPVVLSTINYNIENFLIIPEIWKANGISKVRGKDEEVPDSRKIYYNMRFVEGILKSIFLSAVLIAILMFIVLKPFKDDHKKKIFVVAISISAICYIQTVYIHHERTKFLSNINKDISTQKIFTESESSSNIQSSITFAQNNLESAGQSVSSLYDPIIKGVEDGVEAVGNVASQGAEAVSNVASQGAEAVSNAASQVTGGGRREGFQNFKPQYTSLEDFKIWYRKVREDIDVVNEWRGKGNCQGLCANIDADLESYEREETNKKKTNPDYVFGSHEDDETRLKDLQARILYKYQIIDFIKEIPEATAGKTDIRNWLKKFMIKNFEKNPALPACPEGEKDRNKLCYRKFVETNNDQATNDVSVILAKIDEGELDTIIENNPCNVHTIKAQYGYTEPAPEDC